MTDKTREKIAEIILAVRQYLLNTEFAPEPLGEPVDPKKLTEYFPDAILDLPEIKEGLELREKAKSGKLVELEDDQSRGKYVTWFPRTDEYTCEEAFKMGQVAGELRDKEAGFRRVKVKG